jgi:hypothetical protein
VKALHQQLRAVTVDGQTAGAFLAAVEQPIAIGALAVQLGQQILALIEGGAQRLIQGRHAGALLEGMGAREFSSLAGNRGVAFASRLAPTWECIANVGASLLAKLLGQQAHPAFSSLH